MEDQLFSYLFALSLGFIVTGFAWRFGFFQSIQLNFIPNIRGIDVLIGFGCYLFFEILFVPGLIGFVLRFISDNSAEMIQNSEQLQGWMHVCIILGGITAVVLSSLALTATQQRQLWNQTNTSWFLHICIGIIAWLICYPFVLVLHEGMTLFLQFLFEKPSGAWAFQDTSPFH